MRRCDHDVGVVPQCEDEAVHLYDAVAQAGQRSPVIQRCRAHELVHPYWRARRLSEDEAVVLEVMRS